MTKQILMALCIAGFLTPALAGNYTMRWPLKGITGTSGPVSEVPATVELKMTVFESGAQGLLAYVCNYSNFLGNFSGMANKTYSTNAALVADWKSMLPMSIPNCNVTPSDGSPTSMYLNYAGGIQEPTYYAAGDVAWGVASFSYAWTYGGNQRGTYGSDMVGISVTHKCPDGYALGALQDGYSGSTPPQVSCYK